MTTAEKLIVKVHIPDDKGGGFITLPATTEDTISELKEKFLEKARAKLGAGKLDDKPSAYCLRVKSCNLLCTDENLLLDAVKTVERATMLEFNLTTFDAEKPNHKLLNDRVYFHFAVRKKAGSDASDRQIHFDFAERTITNLNKESERSSFHFDALISFSKSDSDPLFFRAEFKKSSPLELYAQNEHERTIILHLLKRIVNEESGGVNTDYPRTVLHRGYIEKREPKSGNYSRRFVIIVPYKLFCFAAPTGVAHPRNTVALQSARISMTGYEFDIEMGNGYNFHFRTCAEDETERKQWSWALVQASQYTKSPILTRVTLPPEELEAKKPQEKPAGARGRVNTVDIQRSVLNMKVFFNFAVVEQEGSAKPEARILHFNINERVLHSVAKEVVKKTMAFADIVDFALDPHHLTVSITLKTGVVIKYCAQTVEERHIIFALVARVMENDFSGLDANRPRLILKSGYAEKKEKAGVWAKRYLMLLPWKLFCFRDVTGVTYPRNLISLYNANVSKADDEKIVVTLPDGYKFTFRLQSPSQRDEWFVEIQKSVVFDMDGPATTQQKDVPVMSSIDENDAKDHADVASPAPPPPPADDGAAVDNSPLPAPPADSDNPPPSSSESAGNEENSNGHFVDGDGVYAGDESDEEDDAPPPPPPEDDEDDDDDDDDSDAGHGAGEGGNGGNEDSMLEEKKGGGGGGGFGDMGLLEGDSLISSSHNDDNNNASGITSPADDEGGAAAGGGEGGAGGGEEEEEGGLVSGAPSLLGEAANLLEGKPRRAARRASYTTELGLESEVTECSLGDTAAAERIAKERAERLKILGYWGISDKKEGWKERERQAMQQGQLAVPKPVVHK